MVTRRSTGTLGVEQAEQLLAGPSASLPPVVLAAGQDDYLRDRLVAAFKAGGAAEGAELLRFEGDEVGAEDLAQGFAALSLFGSTRRLWIREGSKLDRACEETVTAWAAGPAQGVRVLVTSVRAVEELKVLQALSAGGTVVPCSAGARDRHRWAERLAADAGLKLPSGALEALVDRTGSLLALGQEIEKLRLHTDAAGRIRADALEALAGARGNASSDRWAEAVLSGDRARARAEAASLEAEGTGGTSALWAVASRALAALDPQPYGYARGGARGGMDASAARRALDVVYRADRALKRGELKDSELRDFVEEEIRSAGSHER
jgi:DNA polymerase III delta subunit